MELHKTLLEALNRVIEVQGTDLLLTVGTCPGVRLDAAVQPVDDLPVLDDDAMNEVLGDLLDATQAEALARDRDVDFAFSYGHERFRGNVFYERGKPSVALRLIQGEIPSFDEIGMPDVIRELISRKQGLILFCGPTGSGKSTSMATMVEAVAKTRPCHIITIEDPIEYLHDNHQALVHQREVGIDTPSFARALRAALREDPDVVLVGEMRDAESIAITLTLAETGHLVMSSLHTNDAPQTLDRIVDVFPADRQGQIRMQLASTLTAVVAQRLVPFIGGGLIAVFEVLLGTPAVSNLIREGKTRQLRNAMQIALGAGHRTIEMALNELVAEGAITMEDAIATAFVPHEIDPSLSPFTARTDVVEPATRTG
ncbi:MAG: PilT/PilU family type 4a pilus ATPase [Acidimicrobiia bacterium]